MKSSSTNTIALSAVALAAISLPASVSAHGSLVFPPAEYKNPGERNTYNVKMGPESDPAFASNANWNDGPDKNTAAFTDAFKKTKWKTLKEMIDTKVPDCGNTLADGKATDVSGKTELTFQNSGNQAEGLTPSHQGPCEVWIGDKMVLQEANCSKQYGGSPAKLPVDYSACSGKCQLTFYWLALHEPAWQVYKQCATIQNGGSGASAGAGGNLRVSDAPSSPPAPAGGSPVPNIGGNPAPSQPPAPAQPSSAPQSQPGNNGGNPPNKKACNKIKKRRFL